MNILQLVPKLQIGGVERGTVDFVRYLTLNGHKAVVISGGGRLVKKLDEVGARHYTLPVGQKNPLMILIMIFRVCGVIKKENINIVHARSRVPALIGFFASRFTLRTFITTAHGQYKKHILSYIMGWGKFVIVANSIMARHMIDNFNVRIDKIRIIPRGADINKFRFILPDDRFHEHFTLGMISRITPLKGHLDFIKAVSIVSRSINKLKVYIVGDKKSAKSEYLNQINLLIKRLCLDDIIELLDETDDVPSMLSRLDVLVSANTEQEAFGRIIIEAQSSGVPCVATRVGGVVDIIEDGVTGFLCEPSSPQDMARKILALYRDERLRNAMAKNARKSVEEKYTLDKMMQSTLKVYEETMNSFRILIIKISALGDVILSIPSIRAIRAKYPKATIKVLVGLESRDVLKNLPYIDEMLVCDFKNRDRRLKGFMRVANILRNEDFDIVVDFQNNRKSHLLGFLSFAPIRYGYDNGKFSFLINRKIKDSGLPLDPIEHQTKILHLAGVAGNIDKELKLTPSREERLWAKKFLKDNWVNPAKPIISLNLESSSRWITKRWPVEYFVELSERLAKEFLVRVIVTGQNPSDERNKKFQESAKCKPIVSVGKTTLGQLIALIETSSLLVTSDSAPMHIASACGTPFIALFGPTDPGRHLPPAKDYRVIKKDMKCSPCYKATCRKGYKCMKAIKPDEVFDAVCELLNESITINNPH